MEDDAMAFQAIGAAILAMLALGASASDVEKPRPLPQEDLVVHEWGTFLTMSGSDGTSLDGMYHEEHALPGFVHARSRDQLRWRSIFSKGETPVIYFYTDRERNASVEVGFPRGIWTQWYPQAAFVLPRLASLPIPASTPPSNGRISWNFQIVPANSKTLDPKPPTASADALWNYARDVDAAYVKTYNPVLPNRPYETERFLFYRGLGTAPLPVRMSAEKGGTIAADADGPRLSHLFVLNVKDGAGRFRYIPSLRPGQTITDAIPTSGPEIPAGEFNAKVADALAAKLVEAGLFAKEARAMVNTWKSSYFGTDGVRLLFILPQHWTDATIPMKVSPVPKSLVRVMVGRVELLTPGRERLVERAIRDLNSKDASVRLAAFTAIEAQGRYAEPIIKRVMACSGDESFKALCRKLLLASHVTDLRAVLASPVATRKPDDGMVANEDPVHIRARLALLLREVGLDDEASKEGKAALAALKTRPEPKAVACENRLNLRALGIASEAAGDDVGASKHYDAMLQLGREALQRQDCRKCHQESGATIANGLRDWWAGESYAASLRRLGLLETTIAVAEMFGPDPAARLRLAFLYKAAGRDSEADAAIRPFSPPVNPVISLK